MVEARVICSETGFDEPGRGFSSSTGDGLRGSMQDDAGEGDLDRTRIPFDRGGITFEVVVARCNHGRTQGNAGKPSSNRGEIHTNKEEVS